MLIFLKPSFSPDSENPNVGMLGLKFTFTPPRLISISFKAPTVSSSASSIGRLILKSPSNPPNALPEAVNPLGGCTCIIHLLERANPDAAT